MDAATQRMTEGIQQAIKAEVDGYHFYLMASRSTEDEQGKRVLRSLAEEELEHVRFHALLQQQESMKDDYWAGGGFSPF